MNLKKLLPVAGAVAVVGSVLTPLVASAGTYLTLPEGFVTDTLTYVSDLFTDASLLIILAIGLPLGFWVIRKVISIVRAR